jgi:tetratricopeptide (TPR) repeat protein
VTTYVLGEPEFGRFTRPWDDAAAELVAARSALQGALDRGVRADVLEATIDLGNALTTARRESEAVDLLGPAVEAARREGAARDALGWALLMLATAEQYAGRADAAAAGFQEALGIARAVGDEDLEHYVLHHLGRHLVDSGDLDGARAAFTACLAIRERLGEPRAAQTAAALGALSG